MAEREYIEREAVLDYIDHMPSELTSDGRRMIRRIRLTEYISDSIPAADVAPVRHGRWVDGKGELVPWDEMNENCPRNSAYCSVCGEWLTASDEYPAIGNYCPNCGAKMVEDGDGDV